ncbi:MAG: hypothetical protein IPO53_11790 [Chitinophagaceae bacterium]|nr:hypothetical protein [Chitinophagaceae bacterium]
MKKDLPLVLFVLGISNYVISQKIDLNHQVVDYIKKSTPQASQFQRYGDVPISANTGTANISVPFFKLGIKNVDWNIGIDYNSGGFKVSELAGCAGLGWKLNAVGLISARIYQRCDVFVNNVANDSVNRRTMSVFPTYDPMVDHPCEYGSDIELLSTLIFKNQMRIQSFK